MKLHNALDEIVGNKVKARILRLLCSKNTGWTGRQVAAELALSPTTSSKFLKELVEQGVVFSQGIGKSYLYHLNDRSYVVRNILMPFFSREKRIVDTVMLRVKKAVLKSGAKVESIVVFGSMAKKSDTSRSDIDILIVIKNIRDKTRVEAGINAISKMLASDFHTAVSPYILSVNQLKTRYRQKSSLIMEIFKSYKLLHGKPPERVVL
jgi:predicted nucleotidyltransferase